MTQITTKSGRGAPTSSDLVEAELAVDLDSGSLYTKLGDGKVTAINSAAFIGIDPNADNYQYWRYKVNGKNTVNVFSMQDLDFKAGPGIDIQPSGYGIEISATGGGTGGGGEFVHIGENPPSSPSEGQQWMEVPASGDATMWIYDGDKWLQHPSGKDGAPGADGADGNIADATEDGVIATWNNTTQQWTPDGALKVVGNNIHYNWGYGNGVISEDDSHYSALYGGSSGQTGGGVICYGNDYTDYAGREGGISFFTNNFAEQLRIDASGNATFSGNLHVGEEGVHNLYVGSNQKAFSVNPVAPTLGQELNDGYTEVVRLNAYNWSADKTLPLSIRCDNFYIDNVTSGTELLKIDGTTGNATFSGNVSAKSVILNNGGGISCDGSKRILPYNASGQPEDGTYDLGRITDGLGTTGYRFKDAHFSGTVYANGSPLTRTRDLIETLSTLRNATKDETTLEGLRDAIGNAVGGLIEKFEAMESTATQEIDSE